MNFLTLPLPATLGTNVGAGSDGVLIGAIAPTALTACVGLRHAAATALCYTDDGGLFADEATDFNDAGANDVPLLPAVPAVDDAFYVGHATGPFPRVDFDIGTQGVGTWTLTWEYWNGSAWAALAGVTDGTTGFTATTGVKSLTFTQPTDWARNTVDGVLGYWIRGVVSAYSAITTQPLLTQGWVALTTPEAEDELTDINDAGTADITLFRAKPILGDQMYFGYSGKFCKLKLVTSTAGIGTYTVGWKYWDGSAWQALTCIDDTDSFKAVAGTLLVHFAPPTDWVANTADNGPNGEAGYFVMAQLTVLTSMTTVPVGTQAWVLPMLSTAARGIAFPTSIARERYTVGNGHANTVSGATADSKFLLINATTGEFASMTWTKAVARMAAAIDLYFNAGDELVLVQIQEDGTTELADASLILAAR